MDCVNHSGVSANAYCQSCGKALCSACVRHGAGGQILCEPCWTSWQSFQQPFVAPTPGTPNPGAAFVLGLIPGVGAMYNGQIFKGILHVLVFVVIISITTHYGLFGFFIPAWILYQAFEAHHTARAIRDGQPLPDPLGMNELGSWLNIGPRQNNWGQPGPMPGQGPGPIGGQGPINPGSFNPSPINPGAAGQGPPAPGYQQAYTGQPPYQSPFSAPYAPPAAGFVDPSMPPVPPIPPVPPVPPIPPHYWRRKEPIGAIVLIALGVLFLMGQLDLFSGRLFEFAWPLMLIGLGVWLVIRRTGYGQGPGGPSGQGGPK